MSDTPRDHSKALQHYEKLFKDASEIAHTIPHVSDAHSPTLHCSQPLFAGLYAQAIGRMERPAKSTPVITGYHIANFERRAKGLGLLPGMFALCDSGCRANGSYGIYANHHVDWLFCQYMKQVPA